VKKNCDRHRMSHHPESLNSASIPSRQLDFHSNTARRFRAINAHGKFRACAHSRGRSSDAELATSRVSRSTADCSCWWAGEGTRRARSFPVRQGGLHHSVGERNYAVHRPNFGLGQAVLRDAAHRSKSSLRETHSGSIPQIARPSARRLLARRRSYPGQWWRSYPGGG
jgi:hypothetical protein